MKTFFALSLLFCVAHAASFSRQVSAGNSSVPVFARVELSFALGQSYNNPYDPSQIQVTAVFSTNGVSNSSLPCFYGVWNNQGKWLCRFAPWKTGEWSVEVQAKDSAGTASSRTKFTAVASNRLGFIHRSREDYLHFERNHDGSTYWPVGENMGWGNGGRYLQSYFDWMPKLKKQGCNYIRVWMNLNEFTQEYTVGNYANAQGSNYNVDRLVEYAESLGFGILWCFNQHPTFSTKVNANWNNSPYNSKNGGPLSTPADVWTNARAKQLFKNRYRYTVARWGYSTSVFAWELWNEQDWIDGYSSHYSDATKWAKEMYDYIKSNDPFQHLITTSFALNSNRENIDSIMDWTQYHQYADGGDRISIPDFPAWLTKSIPAMTEKFKKPCITGEFGPSYMSANYKPYIDDAGWSIHNEAWGSLVTGAGGSGFTWWWDNWVEPKNLYYRFKGIGFFMTGQNIGGMKPTTLSASNGGLRALALSGRGGHLVWVQSTQHSWWKIRGGEGQLSLSGASVKVPCSDKTAFNVQVWDTVDGSVRQTISFTCSGGTSAVRLPNFDNNRGDWALKVFPVGANNGTSIPTQDPVPTANPTADPTDSPQPTSGGKGDWVFCDDSSECDNGCCSNEYSGDGKNKCTPNGTKCIHQQQNLDDWVFCTSSGQCKDKCCSKQYSNDGMLKCTPGGTSCV